MIVEEIGKTDRKYFSWCVLHFETRRIEQTLLNKHTITKNTTEVLDINKSVSSKVVQQYEKEQFDLGVGEGIVLTNNIRVGVQQVDELVNQQLKMIASANHQLLLLKLSLALKSILMLKN